MWYRAFLAIFLCSKWAESSADPGILRVPKVYNAVITSNQNLAPSRAYPVIQPVVHRTAIGYVPPYYYTQVAPGFAGPGVVQLDPGAPARPDDAESVETPDNSDGKTKRISSSSDKNENEEFPEEESSSESRETSSGTSSSKKEAKDDRVPLNFYPNYRSVFYGPYFNAFPPNLATPGTYYVNYPQPPLLGPLPGPVPLQPGPPVIPILPGRPDGSGRNGDEPRPSVDNAKSRLSQKQDKIPDIPPPPIPITIRKKTS